MKKLVTIFICLFLTNCTTLTSNSQIVSIDSNPDTANVFEVQNGKREFLGTTPDFFKIERSSHKKILFEFENNGSLQSESVNCKFRWTDVLLGNLIFFYAWPVGVLVDTISGSAFQCPARISAVKTLQSPSKNRLCKNGLLIFPHDSDVSTMGSYYDYWMTFHKDVCQQIIDFDTSVDLRNRYKFYSDNAKMSEAELTRLFKIAKEKKLSNIIFVKNDEKITFENTDIFSGNQVDFFSHEQNLSSTESPKNFASFLNLGINFLPNTIAFSPASEGAVYIDYDSGVYSQSHSQKTYSTGLLTNWGFHNISHPSGFEKWDYEFNLSPDVNFRLISQVEKYYTNKESYESQTNLKSYKFDRFLLVGTYDVDFTIHTPAGAFGLGLGFGPGYDYFSDDHATQHKINFYVKSFGSYTGFLSDNWYIRFFASAFQNTNNSPKTRLGKIESQELTGLEIGYYFPTLGSSLRRTLLKK